MIVIHIENDVNGCFTILNNREDFIEFVESKGDSFNSVEELWKEFGFEQKTDDGGGEILETIREYASRARFKYEPRIDEYPVVVFFLRESKPELRFPSSKIHIFDYASIRS